MLLASIFAIAMIGIIFSIIDRWILTPMMNQNKKPIGVGVPTDPTKVIWYPNFRIPMGPIPVRSNIKVIGTVKFDEYDIQPDGIIEYKQKRLT